MSWGAVAIDARELRRSARAAGASWMVFPLCVLLIVVAPRVMPLVYWFYSLYFSRWRPWRWAVARKKAKADINKALQHLEVGRELEARVAVERALSRPCAPTRGAPLDAEQLLSILSGAVKAERAQQLEQTRAALRVATRVQHTRTTRVRRTGHQRARRCAAPRVRGSRRTAARTTLNTGPPGADDGGGEPEPPSRRSTTGADQRTERAKTARRARRSVWSVGGSSRRVAGPTNDESPRGATLAGIPDRAGKRGVAAELAPRIIADSCPATQVIARARGGRDGRFGRGVLDNRAHNGGDRALDP